MCRLIAFLSHKVIHADEILTKASNSLICQSKHSKSGLSKINADGYGVGWYDFSIEETPSVYRSTQPAWNDLNLNSFSSKLKTHCCVGHVRASTIGDVAIFNCHPFSHKNTLFAHNGTIKDFYLIKQNIIKLLSLENFSIIRGQTDSEHFFALIHHFLSLETEPLSFTVSVTNAIHKAIHLVKNFKKSARSLDYTRLNFILTNGKEMVALRYTSPNQKIPLTLFFKDTGNTLYVASEPFDDKLEEWKEIPENHFFIISQDLKVSFQPISD